MPEELGRPGEDITRNLTVIYQDDDIVVYTAPNEDELKDILLDLLRKHQRMNIRELHGHLSGLASEDKIRMALNDLLKDNKVVVDRNGYFYPAELAEELEEEYYTEYDWDLEYPSEYDAGEF
ncbi:MAG: ArsR family transcriptional regulator [Desulfurococcales archaeon]|nr:ArsR family transcriptional regulator [Desulfurococcales archaeon]